VSGVLINAHGKTSELLKPCASRLNNLHKDHADRRIKRPALYELIEAPECVRASTTMQNAGRRVSLAIDHHQGKAIDAVKATAYRFMTLLNQSVELPAIETDPISPIAQRHLEAFGLNRHSLAGISIGHCQEVDVATSMAWQEWMGHSDIKTNMVLHPERAKQELKQVRSACQPAEEGRLMSAVNRTVALR
jgi:hypothetical protein